MNRTIVLVGLCTRDPVLSGVLLMKYWLTGDPFTM